jgi:hypothetical protein
MARVAWLFLFAALASTKPAAGMECSPPAKLPEVPLDAGPFVLRMADLTSSEEEGLRQVQGIQEVNAETGRVVFQPFRGKADRWVNGAEQIAAYLQLGSRAEARFIAPRDDAVCADLLPGLHLRVTFPENSGTDRTSCLSPKFPASVDLRGYAGAWPGLAEHEMLRDLLGHPARVEALGGGYVVAGRTRQGPCVAWPVNEQSFVCAYHVTDLQRLAPYMSRFGSMLPRDYRPNQERWVENEIRWRLAQFDRACPAGAKDQWLWVYAPYLTDVFPEVFSRFGAVWPETTPAESREWLRKTREFLMANRNSFRSWDGQWGDAPNGMSRVRASRTPGTASTPQR